ncbi:hypothetical protein P167DRAFT_542534 [Morchella conica CCBAS932]|uniref:Uncharacterized protein n=1 Tax=Morchella conica CCBAS932 TaxID=1392247 RepID=A0A3N4KZ39_9PEZI|nr:hypothetical protein P167DRAFT_542534 [Morchella conica CCBAS932]
MLANAKYSLGGGCLDAILKTKEKVYDGIVEHLEIEGYPTEANPDFKEANISDLVYITLHPILFDFKRKTGRTVRLLREKEIVSTDGETGGTEEFVMVDLVSVTEEKFIFIVEAKRSSLGQAMKQCLLAMKDMRDNNGGVGEVYGFVTTAEFWQMLSYDGAFQVTNKLDVLFHTMGEEKEKWMKGYAVLVDCMYAALSNGGIVEK